MFEKSKDAPAIEAFAHERGISRLVHFTPLTNLFGIFELKGLWARKRIAEYARREGKDDLLHYIGWNDPERFDGRLDCINLSIQHINSFLFERFKAHFQDTDVWCILEIDPVCLEKDGVVFTVGNAASSYVRHFGSAPGVEGLRRLFGDTVTTGNFRGLHTETRIGLPSADPTSIQAEVLFPEELPLSLIRGLVFRDKEDLDQAWSALQILGEDTGTLPALHVRPEDFGPRPRDI